MYSFLFQFSFRHKIQKFSCCQILFYTTTRKGPQCGDPSCQSVRRFISCVIYNRPSMIIFCHFLILAFFPCMFPFPIFINVMTDFGFDFFYYFSCWLSVDSGLIWAFVGPALLIILVILQVV